MSLLLYLLVISISILALRVVAKRWTLSGTKDPRPSAPEVKGGWPIIGHLPLFSDTRKLIHVMLGELADEYGPAFSMRLGSNKILVISTAEMARECYTVHDKVFSSRPSVTASKLMAYDSAMFALAPYGLYWREMRKIAMLELLSNHRIDQLKPIRVQELRVAISALHKAWINDGRPREGVLIDMKHWSGDYILDMSLRMVGGRLLSGGDTAEKEREVANYHRSARNFFRLFGVFVLADVIPALGWFDNNSYKKSMKETWKELDVMVGGWLEEHKRKRSVGLDIDEGKDFMDVMLDVMDQNDISAYDPDTIVKAMCLTLLVAATDTSMVSITWTLSLLLNHRDVLRKVQEEIDTHVGKGRRVEESDIKNLTYLQAVVKETFRLYPPGPVNVLRVAREDCTLSNGFHVPAGTRLFTNIWKIQHDESIWPNAFEFIPERFLTSHKHIDVKGQHFEMIPFGAGRRACPGISLALHIVHLTMATLLQGFDVGTVGDEPVDMTETSGFTNVKVTPLKVILTPRLDEEFYRFVG